MKNEFDLAMLYKKYNQRAPRYTSYPPTPFWKNDVTADSWLGGFQTSLDENHEVDLYLHIPYCEKLCWYCGCNRVITKDKAHGNHYAKSLIKEFEIYLNRFPQLKIRSMHLGGGTPNFLTPAQMHELLNNFKSYMASDFEGAIEIDPRTCQREHLDVLSDLSFRRVSLGVQDFDLNVQLAINRVQPFEMIESVCDYARKQKFNHINFDLIWGLPKQSTETIKKSIELSSSLSPDQVSFYSYAHLPSRFKHQNLIKDSDIAQGENKRALYEAGKMMFSKHEYIEIGMDHYAKKESLLGIAAKEKRLLRNFMGYTDKKTPNLIGLGASAISSTPFGFIQNEKDVSAYEQVVASGELALSLGHVRSEQDRLRDEVIQDLMCNLKIDTESIDFLSESHTVKQKLFGLESDGLLEFGTDEIKVTSLGRVFIRNIACEFDEYFQNRNQEFAGFSQTV